MAAASKGSMEVWLVPSFCERINLVTNQVVAKRNILIAPDKINMLTTILMSRELMNPMMESHAHL